MRVTDSPEHKEALKKVKKMKASGKTKEEVMDIARRTGDDSLLSVTYIYWDRIRTDEPVE